MAAETKGAKAGGSANPELDGFTPASAATLHAVTSWLDKAVADGTITAEQRKKLDSSSPLKDIAEWETARSRSETAQLAPLAERMRDPVKGVKVGRRRHLMRTYHSVFVGSELVDWMVKQGVASSRADAVLLGRQLLEHGFFHHIRAEHSFEDDKLFYRFNDASKVGVSSLDKLFICPKCPAGKNALIRLMYHVHEGSVVDWLKTASPLTVSKYFPAVLQWGVLNQQHLPTVNRIISEMAKSSATLRVAIYGFSMANDKGKTAATLGLHLSVEDKQTLFMASENHPGKRAKEFGEKGIKITHPFSGEPVERVALKKEFTSNAKPSWVKFYDKDDKPLLPDAVAKYGDDLRKDLAVQLIFQACAAIWAASGAKWALGRPPYVRTYDVLIGTENSGYLEFVPGRTIKEVEADKAWAKIDLKKFLPSAVGSYAAGFVMGVRDRHSENWMLLGEQPEGEAKEANPELIQIDFGFMLLENPGGFPLDTPRLTMQPMLIKLLEKAENGTHGSLMADFEHDLITAFGVLREHHHALVSFAKVVLSNVYEPAKVETFMWGRHAFHTHMTEREALEYFEEKVRGSFSKINFRRGAKHGLVKAYYAARTVI